MEELQQITRTVVIFERGSELEDSRVVRYLPNQLDSEGRDIRERDPCEESLQRINETAQAMCRLLGALALGSLHCRWVEELFPQFSFVSVVFPC